MLASTELESLELFCKGAPKAVRRPVLAGLRLQWNDDAEYRSAGADESGPLVTPVKTMDLDRRMSLVRERFGEAPVGLAKCSVPVTGFVNSRSVTRAMNRSRRVGRLRIVARAGERMTVQVDAEGGPVEATGGHGYIRHAIDDACRSAVYDSLNRMIGGLDAPGQDRVKQVLAQAVRKSVHELDKMGLYSGAVSLVNPYSNSTEWSLGGLVDAGMPLDRDEAFWAYRWIYDRQDPVAALLGWSFRMAPHSIVPLDRELSQADMPEGCALEDLVGKQSDMGSGSLIVDGKRSCLLCVAEVRPRDRGKLEEELKRQIS